MPISIKVQTKAISIDEFHAIDYKVMGIIFSIHRALGRFWNEKIYQKELAYRCKNAGLDAATEIPILVSYGGYSRIYKIDILINNIVYEIKTAQNLTGEHELQTINYLLLSELKHGKLVNMRSPSVQHRFVSTNLTMEKRFDFIIDDDGYQELDQGSIWLRQLFKNLISEWGVFLELSLFNDAIVYLGGGEDKIVKEILVRDNAHCMGIQKFHMISTDVAFKISAIKKDEQHYENFFRRCFHYTSLKAIHWFNFKHETVVMKTILR
jgi:GxxExxY protein